MLSTAVFGSNICTSSFAPTTNMVSISLIHEDEGAVIAECPSCSSNVSNDTLLAIRLLELIRVDQDRSLLPFEGTNKWNADIIK